MKIDDLIAGFLLIRLLVMHSNEPFNFSGPDVASRALDTNPEFPGSLNIIIKEDVA